MRLWVFGLTPVDLKLQTCGKAGKVSHQKCLLAHYEGAACIGNVLVKCKAIYILETGSLNDSFSLKQEQILHFMRQSQVLRTCPVAEMERCHWPLAHFSMQTLLASASQILPVHLYDMKQTLH